MLLSLLLIVALGSIDIELAEEVTDRSGVVKDRRLMIEIGPLHDPVT